MAKIITYRQALNEALTEEMCRDDSVYLIGEDIGVYHQGGGPSGVCKGLLNRFGPERIIETPICEGTIVGSSVGSAMMGMRPVAEIMHSEFLAVCMQHLLYGGSKGVSLGLAESCPLVIRVPYGGTSAGIPFQDESNESWFSSVPGLKVVMPSSPQDAKGLLKSAIRDDYPVLFFEHKGLYSMKGEVPEDDYQIPLCKGNILKAGHNLTIVTAGLKTVEALQAAESMVPAGIDAEIIDLRTLHPFDEKLIIESVKKTKKLILFFESKIIGSIANDIAATISEKAFSCLEKPIIRLGAKTVPSTFPPTKQQLIDVAKKMFSM
jgi:pyruvate/2-oxoglutarate/acetoin dehydrogenase E1 component